MKYLEPWELSGNEAVEIVVNGVRVAWTVDNDVFIYVRDLTERTHPDDDGFDHFGYLEWEDNDDPLDDAGYNQERLRNYVINKMKENKS